MKTTKNTLYDNFMKNTTRHEVTAKDIKIAVRWRTWNNTDFPPGAVQVEAYNILYQDYGIVLWRKSSRKKYKIRAGALRSIQLFPRS